MVCCPVYRSPLEASSGSLGVSFLCFCFFPFLTVVFLSFPMYDNIIQVQASYYIIVLDNNLPGARVHDIQRQVKSGGGFPRNYFSLEKVVLADVGGTWGFLTYRYCTTVCTSMHEVPLDEWSEWSSSRAQIQYRERCGKW